MPRSSSRIQVRENEVVRRLKAGNGKIAGLKMLAAVDDLAMMPIEVIGIDFYGNNEYRSGGSVLVKVSPTGGHGFLWISPSNLIDNTPAAIDLFDRKCKAQEAANRIASAKNDRDRRTRIIDLRTAMNSAQRKDLDEKLPDRIGEKSRGDAVAAINKASGEYELKSIGNLAAKVLFNVLNADEYDD